MPDSWRWRGWALLGLFAIASPFSIVGAQQASEAKLDSGGESKLEEVLKQLQDNLANYRSSAPDLFCKEHVVSSMEGRRMRTVTVSDSIFRLRKLRQDEDGMVEFEESRELKAVDGKIPEHASEPLSGPAVLSGVFSDGLKVVSRELRSCFNYTIRPVGQSHAHNLLLIDFKDVPEERRPIECPPYEGTHGRATVDRATMHVMQLEKTTPDPHRAFDRPATWSWKVNYAPVQINDRKFWMPLMIQAISRTNDGEYEWRFDGSYKDCHLFHVESHIVPATQ